MKRMREMIWSPVLIAFATFFASEFKAQQPIQPYFFGVNAWMPDTIGDINNCQDPPCIRYGKLHSNWKKVEDSKAQSVRYGGIGPDKNKPTNFQYVRMVDSMRARGLEPILQVPYYGGRYSAQQAAAIVQYVNVTKGKQVKYWIIGNEPNLSYSYTSAAQVAAYIKPFSTAMKAVDPTIKIVGPETAAFKKTITDGLTDPGGPHDITGKDANGRYYIDIFSFHTYPFGNSNTTLATRPQLIGKLMSNGGFYDDLGYLNSRLNAANVAHLRTGANALRAAVTEANVVHTNHSSENLYGVGANSFIGGQFVAEMYGIGMKRGLAFINLWSVIEGGNSIKDNCGYIDPLTGNKKPVYHHYALMAGNFKGNSINCATNHSNVKSFGSNNGTLTSVMILNEDLTADLEYTVRLNTGSVTGTNALKITADASLAAQYSDTIRNQSTVLLTFDNAGNLVKRCVYSLSVHAANNLPPSCKEFPVIDLEVKNASVGPSTVVPGGTVSIGYTIHNYGSSAAPPSNTGFYLSADNVRDGSDLLLSGAASGTLAGGAALTSAAKLTIPSNISAGSYYMIYSADHSGIIQETNEGNNNSCLPLTISGTSVVDLVMKNCVSSLTTVVPGNTLVLTSTIYNEGSGNAQSSNVAYSLSTDSVSDPGDLLLASSPGGALNAGQSSQRSRTVQIPASTPQGARYLLFSADPGAAVAESAEHNNVRWIPINVISQSVDLHVAAFSVSGDALLPGATLASTITVGNVGNAAVAAKSAFYLSKDSLLDTFDEYLGATAAVHYSQQNQQDTQIQVKVGANTPPGNYFVIVFVDPDLGVAESDEGNNTAFKAVTVADGTATGLTETGNMLSGLRVFPNPSDGLFTLELPLLPGGDTHLRVEVIDINGKTVYSMESLFPGEKATVELSPSLPTGVYFLRVRHNTSEVVRNIILKR